MDHDKNGKPHDSGDKVKVGTMGKQLQYSVKYSEGNIHDKTSNISRFIHRLLLLFALKWNSKRYSQFQVLVWDVQQFIVAEVKFRIGKTFFCHIFVVGQQRKFECYARQAKRTF